MRVTSTLFWTTHLLFQALLAGADNYPRLEVQFLDGQIAASKAKSLLNGGFEVSASPLGDNTAAFRGSYEILQSKKGRYLCNVPEKSLYWSNTSLLTPESHLTHQLRNDATFLQEALDQIYASFSLEECVYAFNHNGGYWTYAVCFGDKIIQYHENLQHYLQTGVHEPEYPDYVYVLGRFKDGSKRDQKVEKIKNKSLWKGNQLDTSDFNIIDSDVSPFTGGHLSQTRSQRYIQHTLKMGGVCDLTNEPRTINVMYKCDPDNRGVVEIVDIQEVKTCQYQMIVSLPRLCGIPEFRPDNTKDQVTAINCQRISEGNEVEKTAENEQSDRRFSFPITKASKVYFSDLQLFPLGLGFSIGAFKTDKGQSNEYLRNRHVLIYNGLPMGTKDFLKHTSRALEQLLGSRMLAPVFDGNIQPALDYTDTFILWLEIYDFLGNFLTMVRVQRDGSEPRKILLLSLVDPETMLDQDGDLVEISHMQAPNGAWNYELFSQEELTITETSTVIVTQTAAAAKTENEPISVETEPIDGDTPPGHDEL